MYFYTFLALVLIGIIAPMRCFIRFRYGYHRRHGRSYMSSKLIDKDLLKEKTIFFNSLTRKKEIFQPMSSIVKMYTCGPTVYDFAHIGNFRAFLTYDLIKRWLLYIGYSVEHVCNLTDVDDKIIIKMKNTGKSLLEITSQYSEEFFRDLKMLNIHPANHYPKATDFIPQISSMIETLLQRNFAYKAQNSIYFRVDSFHSKYGLLYRFPPEQNGKNSSYRSDRKIHVGNSSYSNKTNYIKENVRDFALWKGYSYNDGEVFWDMPIGKGRPGWHIECSAMCRALLGDTIDIHCGGVDLLFPHHTNEIMQSEAVTDKPLSKVWMHNGFVNIHNEKMSKSLNNFKTLRDIVREPMDARAFRFLILSTQYRNPINFNLEVLQSAKSSLSRIDKIFSKLDKLKQQNSSYVPISAESFSASDKADVLSDINNCLETFEMAMCDDLNTPRAFAALFRLVTISEDIISKQKIDNSNVDLIVVHSLLSTFTKMDSVLGFIREFPNMDYVDSDEDDTLFWKVQKLAEERQICKNAKQFEKADRLRNEIISFGFGINDQQNTFELYRLKKK